MNQNLHFEFGNQYQFTDNSAPLFTGHPSASDLGSIESLLGFCFVNISSLFSCSLGLCYSDKLQTLGHFYQVESKKIQMDDIIITRLHQTCGQQHQL